MCPTEKLTPFPSSFSSLSLSLFFIYQPMDLGTISKRLKNTFYGNYNEFYKDVKLVFDNVCFFFFFFFFSNYGSFS